MLQYFVDLIFNLVSSGRKARSLFCFLALDQRLCMLITGLNVQNFFSHTGLFLQSFMVKITKQDPWIGLYKRNEEFFWVNGKALDNKL